MDEKTLKAGFPHPCPLGLIFSQPRRARRLPGLVDEHSSTLKFTTGNAVCEGRSKDITMGKSGSLFPQIAQFLLFHTGMRRWKRLENCREAVTTHGREFSQSQELAAPPDGL